MVNPTKPEGARASFAMHSRRPVLLATVALAGLYLATAAGHMQTIDGLLIYRQGLSLAYNHSLHISPAIWWDQSRTTSVYGIGLSLLYIPGLLIWSGFHQLVPVQQAGMYDFRLLYADPLYTLAAAPVHIVAIAGSAYLVARLLQALRFTTTAALWGLALYGLSAPAIVLARGDTAQSVASLAWITAIYGAVRVRSGGRSAWLWLAGLAAALAILARPGDGALIVPAALILIVPTVRFWRWPPNTWRAVAIVAGSAFAALVVNLFVNWGRFGSPFETGYPNLWTTPLPVGLAGALVSPGRGMLWAFPAIVLVPLGVRALWRRNERALAVALVGAPAALLIVTSLWFVWWGGWDWGLRLFFPAVPMLAVLAAIGVSSLPRATRGWFPAILLLGGLVWATPAVVTDLLGGYAAAYDGSRQSFQLQAYPPLGAWRFFQHWRALSLEDMKAADILWLRLARRTHNLSLVPPLAMVGGAVMLWRRAVRAGHTGPEWRRPAGTAPET